jgi:hypothetical protein
VIKSIANNPLEFIEEVIFFLYIATAITFYGYQGFTWIPQLVGVALSAVFLINLILNRRRIGAKGLTVIFILLFSYIAIRYLPVLKFEGLFLRSYIQVFLLTLICLNIGYFSKSYKKLGWGIIVGCIALIISRVVTSGIYIDLTLSMREGGQAGNPNDYSFFLLLGSIFCLIMLISSSYTKVIKLIIMGIFGLLVIDLVIVGGSRASALALFICVFFFLFHFFKESSFISKSLIIFLITISGIKVAQIIPDLALVQRMSKATKTLNSGDKHDKSTSDRFSLIYEGFRLWTQKPIFGYGTNEYRNVNHKLKGFYAHNNYVELLANNGLIGFTLFYLPHLILLFFIRFRIKESPEYLKWFSVILFAMLISDFAMVNYYNKIYLSVLAFMIGHVFGLYDKESYRNQDKLRT